MIATRFAALVFSGMALAGCAPKPIPLPTAPPGGPLRLLDLHEPAGPIAAADLQLTAPGTWQYLVLDEHGETKGTLDVTQQAAQSHGATSCRVESPGGRTIFMRLGETGQVEMTAVLEPDDNALSLFEPPLVMVPAHVQPGMPHISTAAMRVVGDDDPKKVREQGQAMRTVRFAGLQDLVIGSRQRQAIRLEIEFTADLRLADAVEKSTTFIIPGEGIVAEISHETVKVLGAFGKTSSRTIVITSPSEP